MQGREDDAAGSNAIVIGGRYLVQPGRPCGTLAGLPACSVDYLQPAADETMRGGDRASPPLVAIRTRRDAPAPSNIGLFINAYNTTLLMPVAHGPGGRDYWVLCDMPPGRSLQEAPPPGPTSEAELVATYLRPLAQALLRLHGLGLTHRAVRPSNLYRADSGRILLGPGCISPPAYDQPVLYEAPANGLCLPAARGPGTPADDVYSLGVVLLELLVGRPLLAGLDDLQLVQRKLEVGSFQAMAANERLPPSLVSLLRSMVSDDPLARPAMSALVENGVGAERPKAPRPDSRAPRPLLIGRSQIFTARMLAQAFARQPAEALAFLRAGTVDQWLRRALEQPLLAVRIEEALQTKRDRSIEGTEQMILMQIIALLDPQMPFFWGGCWFWPEALPAMLAKYLADGEDAGFLMDALQSRAFRRWSFLQSRPVPLAVEDVERRHARASKLPMAALRMPMLAYSANPYLVCLSPLLDATCVLAADQLVLALEQRAAGLSEGKRLLDTHMLAMLAARSGQGDAAAPSLETDERLLDLHLLASAQALARANARDEDVTDETADTTLMLPTLGGRLAPAARDRLRNWPGKGRRARRLDRLDKAAADGDLVAMLVLVDQREARTVDEAALREARSRVEALRVAHRENADAGNDRARVARAAGRDIALAAGLIGMVGSLLAGLVL